MGIHAPVRVLQVRADPRQQAAKTFERAMEGSHFSIVRDPAFKPSFGPNNSTFRMTDLLMFAFEGKKNLLAPAG